MLAFSSMPWNLSLLGFSGNLKRTCLTQPRILVLNTDNPRRNISVFARQDPGWGSYFISDSMAEWTELLRSEPGCWTSEWGLLQTELGLLRKRVPHRSRSIGFPASRNSLYILVFSSICSKRWTISMFSYFPIKVWYQMGTQICTKNMIQTI